MFKSAVVIALSWFMSMSLYAESMSPGQFIVQSGEVMPLDLEAITASLRAQGVKGQLRAMSLVRANDRELRGLRFESDSAKRELVFFPGNGMSLQRAHGLLTALAVLEANVTWFDPRGLGASDPIQPITVSGLKEDALRVFDDARKQFASDLPVVIHGVSVGTSLASHVAANRVVDGLVLEGAYVSVSELMTNLEHAGLSGKPDDALSKLTPVSSLRRYQGPLLLLVGSEDRVTPVAFTRALMERAASSRKQLAIIEGATHAMALTQPETFASYIPFLNGMTTQ